MSTFSPFPLSHLLFLAWGKKEGTLCLCLWSYFISLGNDSLLFSLSNHTFFIEWLRKNQANTKNYRRVGASLECKFNAYHCKNIPPHHHTNTPNKCIQHRKQRLSVWISWKKKNEISFSFCVVIPWCSMLPDLSV